MLTALRAEDPTLADEMELLQSMTPEQVRERLTANGEIIRALIAWIIAHPDQIKGWMTFILSLFGVVIPPMPPIPTPGPTT